MCTFYVCVLLATAALVAACNSETTGAFSVHTKGRSASVADIIEAVDAWTDHSQRRSRGTGMLSMTFDISGRGFIAEAAYHASDGNISVIVGTNASDSAVVVGQRETGRSLTLLRTSGTTETTFFSRGFADTHVRQPMTFLAEEEPLQMTEDEERRVARSTCAATHNSAGMYVLRLLVVVTPQAAAAESISDISLRVHAAVAEANSIVFPQSHINMRLELAFAGVVNDSTLEQQSPQATLTAVHTSHIITAIRDGASADLVVAYTTLAGMGRRACGIGYMFPGRSSAVAAECFVENYSMLHEVIGHGSGVCHYGCGMGANGFTDGGKTFRTIMAYPNTCNGCTRVPRFSCENNDCRYNAQRIGDFSHNAAWLINERAARLSANSC